MSDFAEMSLPQVREAITKMSDELVGIFDSYKNADTGATDYERVGGDDSDRARELNEKLADATGRLEHLEKMAGSEARATQLSEFMRTPVTAVPQPAVKTGRRDFAGLFQESDFRDRLVKGARNIEASFPIESFGFKATTGEDSAQAGVDVDYPVRADRIPGVVDELFQVPNIADLIPIVSTSSNAVEYVTENYTDAAAATNEAASVSESTADFTLVTENVRKIGVAVKGTEEVLSDVGLMRGMLQLRIQQDIRREEDTQLLLGTGVAPNLDGIIGRAGQGNANWSQAAGTDALVDAIRNAKTAVQQSFQQPTVAIMNAETWAILEQVKDTAGNYLFRSFPSLGLPPSIWGMRVVLNENMEAYDTNTNRPVLIGDFPGSVMIARNGGMTVNVSDSSETGDFLAGVLTFRATMREALIVHRASGTATVTTTA